MKTLRTSLRVGATNARRRSRRIRRLAGAMLLPVHLTRAAFRGVPGITLHLEVAAAAAKCMIRGSMRPSEAFGLATFPMDSVRYLELSWLRARAREGGPYDRLLDVSSPRLFPLWLLKKDDVRSGELLNPDPHDAAETVRLAHALGVRDRCRVLDSTLAEADFDERSFDLISSVSVIEHIPGDGDTALVERLWALLRPGGRLLLSVPCSAAPFEEYLDVDPYGLYPADSDGFYFGQRFYDSRLLSERIFSVTGAPSEQIVYGERSPERFFSNRLAKVNDPNYPFWREADWLAANFRYFHSIDELPGLGVVAMEMVKA